MEPQRIVCLRLNNIVHLKINILTKAEAKEDNIDIKEKSAVDGAIDEFRKTVAYHRVRSLLYSIGLLISVVLFGIVFYMISDIRLNEQSEKLYETMQNCADSMNSFDGFRRVLESKPWPDFNANFINESNYEAEIMTNEMVFSTPKDELSRKEHAEFELYLNLRSKYNPIEDSTRQAIMRDELQFRKKIDSVNFRFNRIAKSSYFLLKNRSEQAREEAMESVRLSDSIYYFLFAIFAILMSVQIFFIRHHQKEVAKYGTLISGILRLKMIDEFSNPIAQIGVASNAFSDSSSKGKTETESPVPGYPISDLTASIFNQLKTKMDDHVKNLDKKS